jgi:hypothetical protein
MRTPICTSIILALSLTACRTKPATLLPSVAARTVKDKSGPPATADSCGVVAHIDITALSAISGRAVEDLWKAMLPRELITTEQETIARATRAATMCASRTSRRDDRAFVLEGDYPSDVLARIGRARPDFVRQPDRAALIGGGIALMQPDARHLAIAPAGSGDAWLAALPSLGSEEDAVLTLSFAGTALQGIFNRVPGVHIGELDGVRAVRATLNRAGSQLVVRVLGTDPAGAARLKAALTELIGDLRARAAKAGRQVPAIGIRDDEANVVVSISVRPEDLAGIVAQLTQKIGSRRHDAPTLLADSHAREK